MLPRHYYAGLYNPPPASSLPSPDFGESSDDE